MAENNNQATIEALSTTVKGVAGKDIVLAVFDQTGENLLAVSGQQGLTINRSSEALELTTKDNDGWKSKIAGIKEWSIDNDGVFIPDDACHKALSEAFENGDMVCLKVVNNKTKKDMFGGMAVITDYPVEAPYDDAMTYSITFEGCGKLVDLTVNPIPAV